MHSSGSSDRLDISASSEDTVGTASLLKGFIPVNNDDSAPPPYPGSSGFNFQRPVNNLDTEQNGFYLGNQKLENSISSSDTTEELNEKPLWFHENIDS